MNLITELIVDAYDCQLDLSNAETLESAARKAVLSSGAHIVGSACHRFQPHGLTLCLILKESHFIISTWPEMQMAIVNIFLCNASMNPRKVWDDFAKALGPGRCIFHAVKHKVTELKKAA